jgi:diguanylate cyclase (GGDEF)-like protein
MISFVHSLADLTSLRDREEVELIMTRLLGDLLGASAVKLWSLISHSQRLRLHERVLLADRIATISDVPADPANLPTLESARELSACYRRRAPFSARPDAEGRRRQIFPVTNAKGVVGFLDACVATTPRRDQQELAAGLIRIYQNHLSLLDDSEKDELTGLLNRKTFDAAFGRLTPIEAPRRTSALQFERIDRRRPADPAQPRWLAIMDIDFFKRVNDRFGHARGDEVLAAMARLMRDSFRESDRLFRCGGEEFVVILEPTDARYVARILERFRRLVETHDFAGSGPITVSMGYTSVAADDDCAAAFRRADEALYAAKRRGRNQVISHEELANEVFAAAAASQAARPAALIDA